MTRLDVASTASATPHPSRNTYNGQQTPCTSLLWGSVSSKCPCARRGGGGQEEEDERGHFPISKVDILHGVPHEEETGVIVELCTQEGPSPCLKVKSQPLPCASRLWSTASCYPGWGGTEAAKTSAGVVGREDVGRHLGTAAGEARRVCWHDLEQGVC